jgi:hypothetical protein
VRLSLKNAMTTFVAVLYAYFCAIGFLNEVGTSKSSSILSYFLALKPAQDKIELKC